MATTSADAALLLRRAGFGGTRQQIDELAGLGRAEAVDRVLDVSTPFVGTPSPDMSSSAGSEYERFVALQQWWIDRMARTTTPIVEKMTLFWHGLFTTSLHKVYNPPRIAAQHHFYRANALGDLRTLVQGMCVQPAMLDYLDNAWSRTPAPNQNFARELMELFLLGAGNYSEDDVDAAARAWTGHSIVDDAYGFRPTWHDSGTKTFFGRTGNLDGPDIVEIILTDPVKAPVMARWIAAKLWEFFAHPNPPAAVVDAIAASLVPSLDITAAVRTLFLRDELYAPSSVQGHVRSPIEYVVAVLRGLPRATAADLHPEWYLPGMGQVPFDPPTVEGWKPNGAWVSTSAAGSKARLAEFARWNLADGTDGANRGSGKQPLLGCEHLSVDDAVTLALETFHIVSPTATTIDVLRSWLTARRSHDGQGWWEPGALFMLVLLCPELQMG